jgi:hypothetical protein
MVFAVSQCAYDLHTAHGTTGLESISATRERLGDTIHALLRCRRDTISTHHRKISDMIWVAEREEYIVESGLVRGQ